MVVEMKTRMWTEREHDSRGWAGHIHEAVTDMMGTRGPDDVADRAGTGDQCRMIARAVCRVERIQEKGENGRREGKDERREHGRMVPSLGSPQG